MTNVHKLLVINFRVIKALFAVNENNALIGRKSSKISLQNLRIFSSIGLLASSPPSSICLFMLFIFMISKASNHIGLLLHMYLKCKSP